MNALARGDSGAGAGYWAPIIVALAACGAPRSPASARPGPAADPTQTSPPRAGSAPAPALNAASTDAKVEACDRERRCTAPQPICLVDAHGSRCGTHADADALPHDGRRAALACASRSDCAAGEHCCTNPLWDRSRCSPRCDAANEAELCESDADCDAKQRCLSLADEADERALPGWLRLCSAP